MTIHSLFEIITFIVVIRKCNNKEKKNKVNYDSVNLYVFTIIIAFLLSELVVFYLEQKNQHLD